MSYTRIAPTPITHVGWGAADYLLNEVKQLANGKILVVADPVLKQIGVVDQVLKPVADEGLAFDLYTDVIPEPLLATGQQLIDFTRKGNYSLVIGIGGGSALDLAKLAAVFADNEGDVKDYLNLSATRTIKNRGIPKILIPTTSGTGAEVTNISVLALEHTKDVVSHDYLIADYAIVDPQLTISVPPKVTAATGADALTHAIESYISVNSNHYSEGLALQAITLISGALADAVADGNNKQARIDMSYGSYLAGLSFFNAGVGAIHALAYPLGGQFHIPHGDSNAVLIPYVMSYIRSCCFKKMADIYQAMGGNTHGVSPEEASVKCVYMLIDLLKQIGIPDKLTGFGIPESALDSLTTDATKQKRLLGRCPMQLTQDDIHNIYEATFTGKIF